MDYSKIIIVTLIFILNNVLIWYQLNSQLVWDWAKGNSAIINPHTKFEGAEVMATDLRASVSLVLAGVVAKNKTTINMNEDFYTMEFIVNDIVFLHQMVGMG